MGTGEEQRCSYCDEPVVAGATPPGCPFAEEGECPLLLSGSATSATPGGGSPSEAEALLGDEVSDEPDGFPEQDDLIDRPLGQYRLGPIIGRGSMGRVYRAEHTGLGRDCAIKVMNPGLIWKQPQFLSRFWAEARAVAGLAHPHIVSVNNLGHDRGYHYLEMEYVAGGVTLKRVLVRDGALEPIRATTLVRQVALALGAAHRSGLVHRDVKPANVLLTADGRAKLADFGLVGRVTDRHGSGDAIAGTPSFMAPELFAGAPAGPATDLYALGVMYYYLLSARLPYAADRLGRLIAMHREAPVPDIRRVAPKVSEGMAAILSRCLAKEPAARHDSADELAGDLESALLGLRDPDDLVREALHGLGGVVLRARGRYRIGLQLPGGRLQDVYVEAARDRLDRPLMAIYSVCGPADPELFESALRLNSELTQGGLSIREVGGRPMFVMTRVYPGGHAGPEEVRSAVQEIARRSDWVERQLTRADVL